MNVIERRLSNSPFPRDLVKQVRMGVHILVLVPENPILSLTDYCQFLHPIATRSTTFFGRFILGRALPWVW